MKKLLISILLFSFLTTMADAQLWKVKRLEISGGIGTTQFFGDIGGYSVDKNVLGIKDFTFRHTRFNINTGLRYRFTEDISLRLSLTGGLFHSTDSRGSNISRGFESSTMFFEPSLIAEYYFIKNKEENSFVFLAKRETLLNSVFESLDFYAFAGMGGLVYHVKPNDVLSPFATKTSGLTGVVPLGIGVTLIYDAKFNFGVSFGGRFTFSDNIDGYTSAKSQSNDVYHLFNFTITYKINTGNKKLP